MLIKPPSNETGLGIFCCTCILCMGLFSPILIYWSYKFNQYKDTIVVRKRYPNIVNIILILLIINIFIRIPLSVLVHTPTFTKTFNSRSLKIIESLFTVYLTQGTITLIALRFWMIYYKLNYTYSSSTSAWKSVINPLIVTNNWFLSPSNKSKYGSSLSMFFYYFFPFYLIYSSIVFFLLINVYYSILWKYYLSYSLYQFIDGFYYLLIMIFCLYLYSQTPNWEDYCFIRKEMKLSSILWFICLIFYFAENILFLLLNIFNNGTNDYVQLIITQYIGLIFFIVYGLSLTYYPISRIHLKHTDLTHISSNDQIQMVVSNIGRTRALSEPTTTISNNQNHKYNNNNNNNNNHHDDLTIIRNNNINQNDDLNTILSDILSSSSLFDLFMNYLSRSFSTESLLSYVEFYQFKQFIVLQFHTEIINNANKLFISRLKITALKRNRNNKSFIKKLRFNNKEYVTSEAVTYNILLPSSVPKSYIIFGEFMVNQINKGKSLKKSLNKLEKSASKYGNKLYQNRIQTQIQIQNQNQNQNKIKQSQLIIESSKSDKYIKELSKTPSKIEKSELSGLILNNSEREKSDKSRDKSPIPPFENIKYQTSNSNYSKSNKLINVKNSSNICIKNNIKQIIKHKESLTDYKHDHSVRLQIPDTSLNTNAFSVESVTEKDIIYDDADPDPDDITSKVGTPSIISQNTLTGITGITAMGAIMSQSDNDDTTLPDIDESVTTTTTNTNTMYNHLTGGVSVEVDEHLNKNREISVTPQPSTTAPNNTITSINTVHGMQRGISNTNSRFGSNNIIKKTKSVTPITPYGSKFGGYNRDRDKYGSTTNTSQITIEQLSVTIDEKEMNMIRKNTLSATSNNNKNNNNIYKKDRSKAKIQTTSLSKSSKSSNDGLNEHLNFQKKPNKNDHKSSDPNTPNTPSIDAALHFGYGDMPIDIEEAKKKTRLIAHKLFLKYISIGAEFEINIPHRMRKKFIKLKINNLDLWIKDTKLNINLLYTLFDECMEEMFALMRSSLSIFIESEDYQKAIQKY